MALVYQPQHLAWKQRVNIELSKSVPRLPALKSSVSLSALKPTPRSKINPATTRTLNLGYTFGGTTPAKYAFRHTYGSTSGKAGSRAVAAEKPTKFTQKRYIDALQTLLDEEKRRQVELQEKINRITR